MKQQVIQPEGWPAPKGYANGIVARGRTLYVAGQVGWDTDGRMADGFVAQFAQALDNVIAVVRAAGGGPTEIVSMTIYVTDLDAYRRSLGELAGVWRDRFGRHYPAMTLVQVAGLVEPGGMVEIQAIAMLAENRE
ncbi:MAG: RidA family protein [Deltaproteobacteria bacterium]|nr:MAG: RidA family protein [Deltaproteobacteria bacterium]